MRRKRTAGLHLRTAAAAAVLMPLGAGVTLLQAHSVTAATAAAATPKALTAKAPTYSWPKIDHDPADRGFSPDPTISSSNASTLGVKWMASTGGSVLSSPVAAWNTTLSKTLVYLGNEAGDLTAFDEATGGIVWSVNLGSAIRSTPLVEGGNVWVSPTFNPSLYKINAATGAIECSAQGVSVNNSSPTIGTPAGGKPTIYIAYLDQGTQSGPVEAVDEATCSVDWQFNSFVATTGAWDPMSFATDAHGRSLLVFGTADPDDRVYALDAATGALVWDFQTDQIPGNTDTDVGSGVSVTAPGVNGFADGMAYVTGRNGYAYGLDLTTGTTVWKFDFGATLQGSTYWSRSTPAVADSSVIFGETTGAYCLDARTGTVLWQWNNGNASGGYEVLSGIAVAGSAGKRFAAMSTLAGTLDVLDVKTGKVLYSYQTGGWSDSSVADVNGHLLDASSDGFLYEFKLAGANGAAPTTTVTSPSPGSTVAYPGQTVTISGTASAPGASVSAVNLAIQSAGSKGPWWDGTSKTWVTGYAANRAVLATPGTSSTSWTYALPVPTSGGVYQVFASAVGGNGLADVSSLDNVPTPSRTNFTVTHSPSVPVVYSASGTWVAPGASITVKGSGFTGGETVDLSLDGTTALASVVATPNGDLGGTSVTIPTSAVFGAATLVASGVTSGKTSSAPLQVSNSWSQVQMDSLNSGNEPNDAVFSQHVSPIHSQFIEQVWSYPTGAALKTTPAVSKGVLYAANDAGTVMALNVHNSQPLWTVQQAASVDSSPALGDGEMIFGTMNDSVVALNQSDGSQRWTAVTTSPVESAPSLAGGDVYVGTDDGTLWVLNEQTGAAVWHVKLTGAISGPPAVDTINGIVVVGDASGEISALSSATGSILWQFTTGGAVRAGATIYNGTVFVGSADGKVYARSEMTGTRIWSFKTGGAITGTGALHAEQVGATPVTYVVGSADGNLYYLGLRTGVLAKETPLGSPIVAVSSTADFVTATTSTGLAFGDKASETAWTYSATAPFASAAALVDGVVYLAGEDQTIRSFTIPG